MNVLISFSALKSGVFVGRRPGDFDQLQPKIQCSFQARRNRAQSRSFEA
jgi:hypothetical protein